VSQGAFSRTLLIGAALAFTALLFVDRSGPPGLLRPVTTTVYQWLALVGASILLLGVLNVAAVHLRRIQRGQPEWLASAALLAALVTTAVVGLLDPAGEQGAALEWLFDSVIAPGQSTLFALLAFFLAAAAYQYLRIGRPGGAWMLAGALLVLIVQMPASQQWLPGPLVQGMGWLLAYPIMAALRGAVLGSALALAVAAAYMLLRTDKG
jgi:hypothetical protein